jgi:hypothetical protein
MKFANGILAIVFLFAFVSCEIKGEEKKIERDGKEFVVIEGDKLGVVYEKHTVMSCERKEPNNIHEEMNLTYNVKLENGTSFTSRREYAMGDSIIYTIYKK